METRVHTPQQVFNMPQRLLVPLFQRPYVWNEENQWAPLWADVARVADRRLSKPDAKQFAHFLGAVVLQQSAGSVGSMQEWMIIDGQQRLTTLQLMLDALHAELSAVEALQPARRIETLIMNSDAYWTNPEDRFKVWPTNRDRAAFNEVMAADIPVSYDTLVHRSERLVQAHRFFAEQARNWLNLNGPEDIPKRSVALEHTVRELLQVVVIELASEENAQEIFETLNARGAQLTAADLIKNFVFQRLMEAGADVERIYAQYWSQFETSFWEAEVGSGRVRYSRSSLFLNHWLIAKTGEEIVAREVFSRFKYYVDHETEAQIADLIPQIAATAAVYREFIEAAGVSDGGVDRVQLFAYRTAVLESEVVKPVVIAILDPSLPQVPSDQIRRGLDALESWLVRRMLVRANTKAYNQIVAELITQMLKSDRQTLGDVVLGFFQHQQVESRYWPDDNEVRSELRDLLAYRKLRRPRLRMVLEAIEDHRRGWMGDKEGLGGARVLRGRYHIEHVMPVKWGKHWPLPAGVAESDRDWVLHTLGNLTLLTARLNSGVSNSAWEDKRLALQDHDVLVMNRDLLASADSGWGHDQITQRSEQLIDDILSIWPTPEGHQTAFARVAVRTNRKIEIADLLGGGLLTSGQLLTPRQTKFSERKVTIRSDGQLETEGRTFATPTGAAQYISNTTRNGWTYFLVDPLTKKSLRDVVDDYLEMASLDADDSDLDDDETDSDDD